MKAESRPRLAFVTPRYSSGGTVGGAETLLKNLALEASSKGCDVTILTTCASDHFTWKNEIPAGHQKLDGLDVHYFPVNEDRDLSIFIPIQERISRGEELSRDDEMAWMTNNVNSRELCLHIESHKDQYDAIIMGPYLFGLIWHAAQVCPEKTVLVPCLHDEVFAYLTLIRELFEKTSRFLFNAKPEMDLAKTLYNLDHANCTVVGMGIDDFQSDAQRAIRKFKLETPYLVYSGRQELLKGTPLMMDYLQTFRDRTGRSLRLVMTGSGNVPPPDGLASAVTNLGFLSDEDKHDVMAGALAFCHPSVNESFSIVLLESWLAQTPVLVNGRSAVMQHQCERSNGGLWFTNYPEFEELMIMMMDKPELCSSLAKNGRDFVLSEYSWNSIWEKFRVGLGLA
jgi:glycosyltransferase involved in cell wall biosynthesis